MYEASSSAQWWHFKELLKRWRVFLKYLLVGIFKVYLKICKDLKYICLWWEQCFLLPSSLTRYLRGHFINVKQLLCDRKAFLPIKPHFPPVTEPWVPPGTPLRQSEARNAPGLADWHHHSVYILCYFENNSINFILKIPPHF